MHVGMSLPCQRQVKLFLKSLRESKGLMKRRNREKDEQGKRKRIKK
jgi:hypothetical protein